MTSNGEARTLTLDGAPSDRALLEILIEAVAQLTEKIDENHAELIEAVGNLNLPGVDYEVSDS